MFSSSNHESFVHNLSILFGAAASGAMELMIFHPLDTAARRLQNDKTKVQFSTNLHANFTRYYHVVTGPGSLYGGFGIAIPDKMFKRLYKYTAQAIFSEKMIFPILTYHLQLEEKHTKVLADTVAGGLTGLGEALLLHPIDTLKVNIQVEPTKYNNKRFFEIIYEQKLKLYNGVDAALGRNLIGSSILFGLSSVIYQYVFKLKDRKEATLWQNGAASLAAALPAVFFTMPFDVLKTRLQVYGDDKTSRPTTWQVGKKMVAEEGVLSLFRASNAKLATSGAKVAFGLFAARSIADYVEKALCPDKKSLAR